MHFAFRTDASLHIGTGHVMRCLTLADALHERGAKSTFICRPHVGHLLDLIQQRGHTAKALASADDAYTAPADPCHAHHSLHPRNREMYENPFVLSVLKNILVPCV
jgi:hypothetical protein